jgi:hypothetical protein
MRTPSVYDGCGLDLSGRFRPRCRTLAPSSARRRGIHPILRNYCTPASLLRLVARRPPIGLRERRDQVDSSDRLPGLSSFSWPIDETGLVERLLPRSPLLSIPLVRLLSDRRCKCVWVPRCDGPQTNDPELPEGFDDGMPRARLLRTYRCRRDQALWQLRLAHGCVATSCPGEPALGGVPSQ